MQHGVSKLQLRQGRLRTAQVSGRSFPGAQRRASLSLSHSAVKKKNQAISILVNRSRSLRSPAWVTWLAGFAGLGRIFCWAGPAAACPCRVIPRVSSHLAHTSWLLMMITLQRCRSRMVMVARSRHLAPTDARTRSAKRSASTSTSTSTATRSASARAPGTGLPPMRKQRRGSCRCRHPQPRLGSLLRRERHPLSGRAGGRDLHGRQSARGGANAALRGTTTATAPALSQVTSEACGRGIARGAGSGQDGAPMG